MRLQQLPRTLVIAFWLPVFVSCAREAAEEVESETVVTVKTAPATRGSIRGVVHATGVIAAAPGAELIVVAPEPARIAEIPRAEGDQVRRGDVLVRFEIPNSAAEVQRQEAEVTRAQAQLANARATQARAGELFERGVTARRDVEDATRAVAEAEAGIAQARASLAAAQTLAGRSTVRATFDGVIAKRLHNPGDLVEAAASDPVLRVIDPRRLEVVASIPLADAPRVMVGASAVLTESPANSPGASLKVISRPAAVEAGTASVPVRLAPAGPLNLPVGSPVQIDIDAEQHNDVVLVPTVAVVREGDEASVFVASGNKAVRRPVTIGLADATQVEVLMGVTAGEMVIVDGQAGLPDDAAITIATGEDEAK